jgi:hypothetical protein
VCSSFLQQEECDAIFKVLYGILLELCKVHFSTAGDINLEQVALIKSSLLQKIILQKHKLYNHLQLILKQNVFTKVI